MSFQEQYAAKRVSAAEAIRHIHNGDTVVVPTAVAEPPALLNALSEHRRDFRDVKVSQILAVRKFGYLDPSTAEHVRHVAYFFSGATRPGFREGVVDFTPSYFSEMPQLIDRGLMPSEVVFTQVSPMDQHGYFSLGIAADYTIAAIRKARAVVVEVNPNVPYTFGNCHIHISQVTALVENDEPVLEVGLPTIGPVQEAIGKYVADLIDDGSTLQIGYGGIPDAVVMQLTHKQDLGIHTEMIGDGILTLIEAGAVTNRRKNYLPNKMVATFALGSKKLYSWMDRNPMFEMHPVDFTNDPYLAGPERQPDRHQRDPGNRFPWPVRFRKPGADSLFRHRRASLTSCGAANRSKGGKAFIVLPSTAKDGAISRIAPTLTPGTHVSTSKNDINYVVTEYGVAQLRGKTAKERAQALIGIAHPDFRAELTKAAKKMHLL